MSSDDEETVWVLPHVTRNGDAPKAHPDPDCWALQQTDGEPVERPASDFYEWEICGTTSCSSADVETSTRRLHAREAEARLENRQSVYEALAAAGEPLTRREVQLEALVSSGVAQDTLADLEDLGQVEQVENPDDGRIPRYRLVSMCPEAPQRQRAQAHPVALWALGTTVALVLMASIAASGVLV